MSDLSAEKLFRPFHCLPLVLSKEARSAVEGTISRRLSMRPTKEELQQRNILKSKKFGLFLLCKLFSFKKDENISEKMAREEFERKRGILTRKV